MDVVSVLLAGVLLAVIGLCLGIVAGAMIEPWGVDDGWDD